MLEQIPMHQEFLHINWDRRNEWTARWLHTCLSRHRSGGSREALRGFVSAAAVRDRLTVLLTLQTVPHGHGTHYRHGGRRDGTEQTKELQTNDLAWHQRGIRKEWRA